ncbi:putative UDP-3-O-acyl-N-acetylglucosamine deacetylase 5 mitochondrial, partial [Bienertia sinuspersici]
MEPCCLTSRDMHYIHLGDGDILGSLQPKSIFYHNIGSDHDVIDYQVPILDGSAKEWVEAIEQAGLEDAVDEKGNSCEKMAPYVKVPVYSKRDDSFIVAFPSEELHITYGINFPEVPSIGCQWFFSNNFNRSFYSTDIASARTFCVYEEVEKMREMGLIKGGSLENAIVCSASKGWLDAPLRFCNEPCRHKVLDLIGDLSVFAKSGNQGLPIAHIIAYKV